METTVLAPKFSTREAFRDYAKRENVAFLEANKGRVVIEYVREAVYTAYKVGKSPPKRRGQPNAVLVAYKEDDGTIRLGWSAARSAVIDGWGKVIEKGDNFDKIEGLWRAIRRASSQGRPVKKVPRRLRDGDSFLGVLYPGQVTISEFIERATEELNR